MPYSYYILYMSQEYPVTYYHLPGAVLVGIILDSMNLFWYRKMVLGALRVFRRHSSATEAGAPLQDDPCSSSNSQSQQSQRTDAKTD